MMRLFLITLFCGIITFGSVPVQAAYIGKLQVTVKDIKHNRQIPNRFAYCIPDGKGQSKDGYNFNPAINWSGAPVGTRSFAIIVVDRDVPTSFELANKKDKKIPHSFSRQDFYHWVLVDIPANMSGVAERANSKGIVPDGKPVGKTPYGINGQNDYVQLSNKGSHGGYDGPCPPWNDERLHRYHFIVYALDVESLKLKGKFDGRNAMQAMKGHILAEGEVMGNYAIANYAHKVR